MPDTLPSAPPAPLPRAPARPTTFVARANAKRSVALACGGALVVALATQVQWYRVTLSLSGTDPEAGRQVFSQSFAFRGTRIWLGQVVVGVALGVIFQTLLALRFSDRSVGPRVAGSALALLGLVALAWPAGPKMVEDLARDRSGIDVQAIQSALRTRFPMADIRLNLTTVIGAGYRATLLAAVVTFAAAGSFALRRRAALAPAVAGPFVAPALMEANDPARSPGGFLQGAIAEVRGELAARPLDEDALRARLDEAPPLRDFAAALRARRPSLIAEVKRASPSAGHIADADAALQASAYERAGAAAISVLTLPRHFGGSIDDLRAVRSTVEVPVLRKDFLVHPSQLLEARVEGADAVLLIVSALTDDELRSMLAAAAELGLAALVETHDAGDVGRAVAAGAGIIGVNARDLVSLEVDVGRALGLLAMVPAGVLKVIESGVSTREQVVRAVDAGADAVLVGEALMRAADPVAKIEELLGGNEER